MDVGTAGQLSAPVTVSRYVPAAGRAAVAWPLTHVVVRSMAEMSTESPSNAAKYLSHLADFAAWAHGEGVPLTSRHLLDLEVIERYIAVGMTGARDATRATRRAILRRIARRCHPSPADPPPPIAYRRLRPPYSPAEVDAYLGLAASQPTPNRRRSLQSILHLGLGCGLASRDLAWVTGSDVRSIPAGGVTVRVSGGTRPRTVTALQAYEDPVARLAQAAGSRLMIGGHVRGRRNVTRGPLCDVVGGEDLPRLETARLRSTWLLSHLRARTPLPALMQAAGLTTVRPLEDLLGLCPMEADEVHRSLRGAG